MPRTQVAPDHFPQEFDLEEEADVTGALDVRTSGNVRR
jgi:hypothetical protein